MQTIEIKQITIRAIELLQEISKKTFFETFASSNTAEDMEKYLSTNFSNEKLTVELSEANSLFYFAVTDAKVIGYLKLNFGQAQTEMLAENALEIERIYVLKDFLGKQIGQILYEKALQIAREKQVSFVWLGVWEKNTRAIAFYQKNGFVKIGTHIFKLGNDEQTDFIMKLDC
jgi:ribosomal protein S18 acetylase RimI-like enzyme